MSKDKNRFTKDAQPEAESQTVSEVQSSGGMIGPVVPKIDPADSKAIYDGWYWGEGSRGLAIWIAAGSEQEAQSILGEGSVVPASTLPTTGEDYLVRIDGVVWRLSKGGWYPGQESD